MFAKSPCVYMLAGRRNGTLYVGVTSDLVKRTYEHQSSAVEGFTRKYGVHTLVWYELHDNMCSAIEREKQIKKFNRSAKLRMIELRNPEWHDLSGELIG